MPDDSYQTDVQDKLVMRGYRRHRKHSRWGLISLFCPAATIFWAVFWYLIMNQVEPNPDALPVSHRTELMWSMVGCLAFATLGVVMSLVGLMGHRTRHHLASAGLAVNLALLMVLGIMILLGLFGTA